MVNIPSAESASRSRTLRSLSTRPGFLGAFRCLCRARFADRRAIGGGAGAVVPRHSGPRSGPYENPRPPAQDVTVNWAAMKSLLGFRVVPDRHAPSRVCTDSTAGKRRAGAVVRRSGCLAQATRGPWHLREHGGWRRRAYARPPRRGRWADLPCRAHPEPRCQPARRLSQPGPADSRTTARARRAQESKSPRKATFAHASLLPRLVKLARQGPAEPPLTAAERRD